MSKRHGWAAVLGSIATAGPAFAAAATPSTDHITMEDYSWGRLLWSWTVNADGSGQFTSTVPRSKDFNDRIATTKRWGASPGRHREVADLLNPVEAFADKALPCNKTIYDLQYGNLTWIQNDKKRVVNFDLGCRSAEVDKLYAKMGAAYGLVTKWTVDAPGEAQATGQ